MSRLQHRSQRRIAIITAIALMFAQLGAMAHAYTHVPGMHVPSMRSASVHQSTPDNHDYCSDCLAYSPLLSVAGTPTALPFVAPQGCSLALHVVCSSLVDHHPHLAFRSRAPPITH